MSSSYHYSAAVTSPFHLSVSKVFNFNHILLALTLKGTINHLIKENAELALLPCSSYRLTIAFDVYSDTSADASASFNCALCQRSLHLTLHAGSLPMDFGAILERLLYVGGQHSMWKLHCMVWGRV